MVHRLRYAIFRITNRFPDLRPLRPIEMPSLNTHPDDNPTSFAGRPFAIDPRSPCQPEIECAPAFAKMPAFMSLGLTRG